MTNVIKWLLKCFPLLCSEKIWEKTCLKVFNIPSKKPQKYSVFMILTYPKNVTKSLTFLQLIRLPLHPLLNPLEGKATVHMLPLRKDAITPPPLWRFHPFLTLNPGPSQVQQWGLGWVCCINALYHTLSPDHISVWSSKRNMGVHLYILCVHGYCMCFVCVRDCGKSEGTSELLKANDLWDKVASQYYYQLFPILPVNLMLCNLACILHRMTKL